ncbi:hypothetical protein [Nocardioides sp. R-C-SC26]|uniref:hypothetical protein n=1 Tax=Nocardioides sp. R-C-SC26 TaxID=2870414 RepID=UPI001E39CE56|nr:hypothetical protein [Nocardioides sp. R-C-SC26]
MSAALERRAETIKLARLLGVGPEDLPDLDEVDPDQIRLLRERATDRLFDASAGALGAVGAAARLVPSGISATIAERAFGPLLCARAAAAVDPAKAVDIARRLEPEFLADTAIELDPRRVAAILGAVPDSLAVPVARVLGRRGEHVTMGRFLAYVSDAAIVGAMGVLDDESMLRTAFVLEHKDRLDHAVALLPADRVPGVLRTASDLGLWAEALDLLDHLSEDRRGPIADTLASLDHEVIGQLVDTVCVHELWESLLPIVRLMAPPARARLAAAPAFHRPPVLSAIVAAAAASDLWRDLVPLLAALPDDLVAHVREDADRRGLIGELDAALAATPS